MASKKVRRTSTVSTKKTVHSPAAPLKANIERVRGELMEASSRAREEVGALDRIRHMLDGGVLTDLMTGFDSLYQRVEELESVAQQSASREAELLTELEAEQGRLEKLWDAYKKQEDELLRLQRDYPLLEEKLFDRERLISDLRREVDRLPHLEKINKEYQGLQRNYDALRSDRDALRDELQSTRAEILELESERESLRALEVDQARLDELEGLLDQERERLAKLLAVYETEQARADGLADELAAWRAWYAKFEPLLGDAAKFAGSAPSK